MKKLLTLTCLVALLGATSATAQVSFERYVALGDSMTAGYASGSLHEFYQERSYPARLAAQAGATPFEQPLVGAPGMGPIMALVQLSPGPVILPSAAEPGAPLNAMLARPYDNLGIPGASLYDMLNSVGDINNLLAGNTDNVMHDMILRDGQYPAIAQAIGLDPTFITMWIGNNDILSAAVMATALEGVTMTPLAMFEQQYMGALEALTTNTSADIVVFTIPDVAVLPFVTAVAPYLDTPIGQFPLLGPDGPLPPDTLLTLGAGGLLAQGIGVPVELGGTGLPLPDDMEIIGYEVVPGVILRPDEVATIRERVNAFNDIIVAAAATYGASVFDFNGLFTGIHQRGWEMSGIALNTGFLAGGLFSYDGVHAQNLGYGVITYELIDFINAEFGANIPQLNMAEIFVEGNHDAPMMDPIAADKVLFSAAAFDQLQEIFPVNLPTVFDDRQQFGAVD